MMHAYPIDPPADPAPAPAVSIPCSGPTRARGAGHAVHRRHRGLARVSRPGNWARACSKAARERAQSLRLRELSLLCFAGNTGARRLYERAGFVVVDWRPVMPHPMIRHTGDVLLMQAPV